MQELKANTAVDVLIGPFVDSTDGDTAETALTISQADVRLSKNGQNMAQKNDATAAAHDELGYYNCELDSTDVNTEGTLVLAVHETGALPVRHEYMVLSEAAWDSKYAAKDNGYMDVNIKTIGRADTQETEANNLESACSNYSATRGLTGTALPAAAADAAGGVPISDAGGLDLDDIPITSEFEARTLASADYVVTSDTIAGVTLVATTTDVTNGVSLAAGAVTDASLAGNMEIVFETDFATNYNTTRNGWATNLQDTIGTGNLTADVIAISGDTTAANNAESAFDGTGFGFTNCTMPTVTTLSGHTAQTGDVYGELPTNFSDLAISVAPFGYITAGTVADKSGYSILGTITTFDGLENVSATDVNAQCDASIETYHLDHLLAVDYDPTSKPGTATALLNELVENDGGVSRFTENALEQAPTGGSAPTAEEIVNEWETQSQADPTGFHVNVMEIGGTTQTANDNGADINAILVDTGELQTNQGNWATATSVDLNAGAIDNASLAGNMEIVFETDFATNYNTTRDAWVTNHTDYIGTIPAAALGADCITSAKVADDAFASEHFATGAFTADVYAADALVAATFATDSITTDALADGTITAAKLAGDCITAAKIADDAISSEHLNTGALTADAFAADALVAATFATGAFTSDAFAADALVAATFNTGAFTADAFAADAFVAATFATDSIAADALAADALTEIQASADAALVAQKLDHLVNVADADDVENDSIVAKLAASDGDWSGFSEATDSLEALRDHVGDGANLTEAGGDGDHLAEAGGDGDHLTAINLPNQTMDITGDITGNLSGSVGSVTGAVGSVTGNVGGNVTGTIGELAAQAKTDVNAEVSDVMKTDTISDLSNGAPTDTPTMEVALMYLYSALTKQSVTKTSGTPDYLEFYNGTGTIIWRKQVSDDGSDYTELEGVAGS